MREAKMCAVLYAHFSGMGYAVHGEVDIGRHGYAEFLDVAAVPEEEGHHPIAIEAKVYAGEVLLRQLQRVLDYTPHVYAALPHRASWPEHPVMEEAGIILVDEKARTCEIVKEPSPRSDARAVDLRRFLNRWNRDVIGGSPALAGVERPTRANTTVWELHLRMMAGGHDGGWSTGELLDVAGDLFINFKIPRTALLRYLRNFKAFQKVGNGLYRPTGLGVPEPATRLVPPERPWYAGT